MLECVVAKDIESSRNVQLSMNFSLTVLLHYNSQSESKSVLPLENKNMKYRMIDLNSHLFHHHNLIHQKVCNKIKHGHYYCKHMAATQTELTKNRVKL